MAMTRQDKKNLDYNLKVRKSYKRILDKRTTQPALRKQTTRALKNLDKGMPKGWQDYEKSKKSKKK